MLVTSCYTHSLFTSYLRYGMTVLKMGTRGLRAGESFHAEPERVTVTQSGGLAWSRGPTQVTKGLERVIKTGYVAAREEYADLRRAEEPKMGKND